MWILLGSTLVLFACAARPAEGIMSFEAYAKLEHEHPYVFRAAHGRGRLLYFGTAHFFDPDDPQVEAIVRAWNGFRPTLLLYEGPPHTPPIDMRAAIAAGEGEGAVVRSLAARAGIEARSFDPDLDTQERGLVASGYRAEDVTLYFVLRQVMHERKRHHGEALDARMQVVLDHYRDAELERVPPTVPELAERVRTRFPELPDFRQVPDAWFDPVVLEPPHFANRLSRSLGELRDRHMVAEIRRAMERGHRVFVVAGSSHAVMQEPALRR